MRATLTILVLAAAAARAQQPSPGAAGPPAHVHQDVVHLTVPSWAAERAGGSNNAIPFGFQKTGPTRYQQFFRPETFEFDGTLLFSGVAFRLNRPHQVGRESSGEIEIEITLATAPANKLSGTFEANLANSRVVVLPRRTIPVRASPDRDDPDQDIAKIWDLVIPFERTYRYRTGEALVLDVKVFGFGEAPFQFSADALKAPAAPARAWGGIDAEHGRTDNNALVVRFDVAARAAKSAAAPASRPARQ